MPIDHPSERHVPDDVFKMSVATLGRALRDGSVSPVELAQVALQRIAALDAEIHAFVTVNKERALEDARRAEQELRAGIDRGPLHGLPLVLKDLVATRGIRTTAGSQVLSDYIPDEDAAVAQRLTAAGTVLLGKANTHEFAYGTFTRPTANPWDLERIPGGSSGGSAAALAARMCSLAIGTDTGGSIRIPAACCGVTGLKPTYGLVSVYGIIPLSWSLDHAGPLARTVEDCAQMLDVLAGSDPRDPASLPDPAVRPTYAEALQQLSAEDAPLAGLRLGVPENDYFTVANPEIGAAVQAALETLEELGAQVESVRLPDELADLFRAYRGVQMPEATAAHIEAGWWPTRADAYSATVRSRLEMGGQIPATEYVQAQRLRRAFAEGMRSLMQHVDALALPTLPILPPRIDQLDQPIKIGNSEFDASSSLLRFTFPFNMTGQPALALPCGFSTSDLPISLQLAGRHLDEQTLLRIGYTYQQATEWHLRQPS
ncbi:MAG TPA: amidase [Ktedonobacterales bacterium]|nr:amidase [Ktedonobacterales bacterium]